MAKFPRELLQLFAQRLCLSLLLLGAQLCLFCPLGGHLGTRLLSREFLLLRREFLGEFLADALFRIRIDRQRICERL